MTRLSKLITECLKLVRSHCTAYCKTIRERTGVNCMCIINNSLDVICALEEKLLQLSLNHMSTWDFSTLYTLYHMPSLKSNFMIFRREFLIPKEKALLLPIIFAPYGRMIRRQRSTHTSPVESLVSLLTFLSITSTFVLEARFSSRLLVYPWAPTVHLCWLISSFIPLSTILWSKQWNKTLQKPSSSATPFDISMTYSVLTMWTLEIASARFTRRNWNLRTHPHHLLKCVILTQISWLRDVTTPSRISIYDKRDDFAFRIVNFPHMDSNIPANPAYGVYISQLVRYARICTSKVDFINRLHRLSLHLRQQGFETNRLHNSLINLSIAMLLLSRSMVQAFRRWD